jgi:phage shock protein C
MTSIRRSRESKVVAGVLGGIAEHYGWSATRLRIVYCIVSILSAGFPGTLVYLALWYLIPDQERPARTFRVDSPDQ